jgi:di/tricarboxylate transporter
MIVAITQALSQAHMIIAWAIFLVSYFVFAVGRLPGTKIDRPAMAVIGAVLMFAFGVLAPAQAIASIDFATLVLLFAMMLIVASLHLAGFFQWVSYGDGAPLAATPSAGRHLHQRRLVGVSGE